MTLGEELQKARERRKKTQAQIADEVGCTQAAVAYWESNKSRPDPGKWRALSAAYGVRIGLFLELAA
jgi:transcriptional regulator with XRE-family HTH domain